MRVYIRYEIEERKFSANTLVGIRLIPDPNKPGKTLEKKDIVLLSPLPKVEGDIFIEEMYEYYEGLSFRPSISRSIR